MNSPRTMLYRDKLNGKILGVCAGIADYTGISAGWVRILTVMSLFVVGPVTFFGYIIAGLALKKKPAELYVDKDEQKYWQRVRQSPKRTAREIRSRFRDIDRRLADVESFYVSSNPRLTAEIERLR